MFADANVTMDERDYGMMNTALIKKYINALSATTMLPISCRFSDGSLYFADKNQGSASVFSQDAALMDKFSAQYAGNPELVTENDLILYAFDYTPQASLIVLGPISLRPLKREELKRYKESHSLTAFKEFGMLSSTPLNLVHLLAVIHFQFYEENLDYQTLLEPFQEVQNEQLQQWELYQNQFLNSENDCRRISYEAEKEIMSAISNGNRDYILKLSDTITPGQLPPMSKIPHKQLEYTAVSGITLYARAAVEGGLSREEANNLSDYFLQKLSVTTDVVEIQRLSTEAILRFCDAVGNCRKKIHKANYIEHAKQFIQKNRTTSFTLEDISNAVGVSKCYLTNQFSRQEGITLTNYIHKERIEAAKNMLKYSNEPISVIASYLCFDSQSHFGSIFKKLTGTTPAAYRREHKLYDF